MTTPARTSLKTPTDRLRRRVYEIIEVGRGEDRASKTFGTFIVALNLLNIAAFAAETIPDLEKRFRTEFLVFEIFSVAIFTVEYLARLWVAVEVPFLSRLSPLHARTSMA
jgi:voltage-gated potassium channel